jgi:hypothetical protein
MSTSKPLPDASLPDMPWPDSNSTNLNSVEMDNWATQNGFRCVYPEPNQLQIDIDSSLALGVHHELMSILYNLLGINVVGVDQQPSKTNDGQHFHITLTLPEAIDDKTRILMQAVLGSDVKRELLSYGRLLQGDPHPTMFAEVVVADKREGE